MDELKLPLALKHRGESYTRVKLKENTLGALARSYRANDNPYRMIYNVASNSIDSFLGDNGSIKTRDDVHSACYDLSYASTVYVVLEMARELKGDEGVEGVYACPRCGTDLVCGIEDNTADRISSLEVNYADEDVNTFRVVLDESVEVFNSSTKETIVNVTDFELEYPTMRSCIEAAQYEDVDDSFGMQSNILGRSLVKTNGEFANDKFKNRYGRFIFNNLKNAHKEYGKISQYLQEYGFKLEVKKKCRRCKKVWYPTINVTNFFASALSPT